MLALINFVGMIIDLYIWVIIISAVMSWLIAFDVINRHNRLVYSLEEVFFRLTEPVLMPIRNFIPNLGGIDLSPIVLILILIFLRDVVIGSWLVSLLIQIF